jgi:hypothetical protein
MTTITGTDIHDMIRHQLQTPVNGYLGSGYGSDTKALLQRPQATGEADAYLAKLRSDVPILKALPSNSVNLYGASSGVDKLNIVLEVAGTPITIGSL